MRYCAHCGKEIAEDVSVCLNCGCEAASEKIVTTDKKPGKKNRKKIVLIVVAAVLAIALLVAGYFVYNYIRAERVIDDLSGQTFRYYDVKSYPSLGKTYYTSKAMKFDGEGVLTYSYYYSSVDVGDTYQPTYKIRFKGDMIILETAVNQYEVMYDRYGQVSGLYDFVFDELHE